MRPFTALAALLSATAVLVGCSSDGSETGGGEDNISSESAKILDFTFDGELTAPAETPARAAIVSQLMYVQGALTTARNGNGHVGNVKLEDVRETRSGATKKITYKATLPVAWPKNVATPSSYDLKLPVDATKLDQFNEKYDGRCGNNEYGQETFWHDWNPKAAGCTIDEADVMARRATVAPSARASQNKFPEYQAMWADGRLDVVAIFGIISSNTPGDEGYLEAKSFVENTKRGLSGAVVKDNETSPSILKDQTVTGKVTIGGEQREVKVDVIVVQELKSVGRDFDTRYDGLSEKADMILYNGHAGLGKNVNALARKGKVAADKYQLVLLNGCQTFAYIDTTLMDRRREANGETNDPSGTKFLDVVGNALPGYANNLASMSNTLFNAALSASQAPKSYNDLLRTMPESHIVVVFGEEDNRDP